MVSIERRSRSIFCNRTLNFRALRAVGYDMDYTLVHYRVDEWERRAYQHLKQHFLQQDWPVQSLEFDPEMVCRGLIVDTELGNLVKANRFGFVKKAMHGTRSLDFEQQRQQYSRTMVDLAEKRWIFMNTLFSLSEGCMFSQLVDLLDARRLPGVLGYADLYRAVRSATDAAHMEGRLKAEIIAKPEQFVELDPDMPQALLDQKEAGKKLLLITNSDWAYAVPMMAYAFDRFLPPGMTWRSLFDVVVIGARKPEFFTTENPFFEIASEEGLLRTHSGPLQMGKVYFGGSAAELEKSLGLSGDEILYVGDHVFGDVHVTKRVLRWRTALILRELEDEIESLDRFQPVESRVAALMAQKEELEARSCAIRLELQRARSPGSVRSPESSQKLGELRAAAERLDLEIGPLARQATELSNPIWGLLMRAGNDKSHLAFQVERYADIYTSRVSNFLRATPFVYLRSVRGNLPHDAST